MFRQSINGNPCGPHIGLQSFHSEEPEASRPVRVVRSPKLWHAGIDLLPCLFGSFLTCPQEAEAAVLANDGGEVPRHAEAQRIPVVLKLDSDDSERTIPDHVTRRSRQASYSWPAAASRRRTVLGFGARAEVEGRVEGCRRRDPRLPLSRSADVEVSKCVALTNRDNRQIRVSCSHCFYRHPTQ